MGVDGEYVCRDVWLWVFVLVRVGLRVVCGCVEVVGGVRGHVCVCEALAGPYVWGRYDLLLLPPSFPYGGMENPCLTFVTPTLLAGDRSLTNVVAHEIAHSWTGNLVTNSSWEHFWLNEGWTVFLERKIVGRLKGEKALQFHAAQGAASLEEEVKRIGADHNFTRLVPDLSSGEDPDDAFSRIPYEKGFYFLYYLQDLVGGADACEPFMRSYLSTFAFKTVSSDQFKEYFLAFFKDNPAVAAIDWDTWFYAPGMPPVKNSYDTSLATAAYDLAVKWHTADIMGIGADPPAGASAADIDDWDSEQIVAFLDRLGELRSLTPLAASICRAMDRLYNFDSASNCEIRTSKADISVKELKRLYKKVQHATSVTGHPAKRSFFDHWQRVAEDHTDEKLQLLLNRSVAVVAAFIRDGQVYAEDAEGDDGDVPNTSGVSLPVDPSSLSWTPWAWRQPRQLVGFVRAAGDLSLVATIHDCIIHPDVQGLGLGSVLIKRCVNQVASEGVYDVGLVTPNHLQPFFNSCSFELDHEESVPMALQQGWDKDVQQINASLQENQALHKLLRTAMDDDQRRLFATW
eukprot:gene9872-10030_t